MGITRGVTLLITMLRRGHADCTIAYVLQSEGPASRTDIRFSDTSDTL